jgi:hypothetical protein
MDTLRCSAHVSGRVKEITQDASLSVMKPAVGQCRCYVIVRQSAGKGQRDACGGQLRRSVAELQCELVCYNFMRCIWWPSVFLCLLGGCNATSLSPTYSNCAGASAVSCVTPSRFHCSGMFRAMPVLHLLAHASILVS